MYRLTLSGEIADAYIRSHMQNTVRQWIKIYRWGDKWGEVCSSNGWENRWKIETRKEIANLVQNQNLALLEEVQPLEQQSPPIDIDDSWEEEMVLQGSILFGNLLILIGNASDIEANCRSISLPFLDWVCSNMRKSAICVPIIESHSSLAIEKAMSKAKKYKPVCIIEIDAE